MSDKKFAAAINCVDGRTQIPVMEWMKKNCRVDYVDMVTEPGPVKILKESLKNMQTWGFKVQLLGLWVDENRQVHKTA